MKRWKLSPIDLKAREKYADYGRARDEMLAATHNKRAPWTLVDFNDQRRGRLALIRHLLDHLPDTQVPVESDRHARRCRASRCRRVFAAAQADLSARADQVGRRRAGRRSRG